jgi:hypothetical protein
MKHIKQFLLLAALSAGTASIAQTYQVGDIVEDWTFTDYRTGASVNLHDLGAEGGVLVLEWFAWWCPFCARAAANVETGIVEYYAARGGTPDGLPVKHISLNVQGGARASSDAFIEKYNLGTVLEDYSRTFFNLFSPSGGQPLFVIINAEANSPSAERWEVLYTRLNYFTNEAPDISALMRPVIDSVEAGTASDPVLSVFSDATGPVDNWYESTWFGWFNAEGFPGIFHADHGYGQVASGGNDTIYFNTARLGWTFTGPQIYPFLYSFSTSNWLYYQMGSNGLWFYDYAIGNWRSFE